MSGGGNGSCEAAATAPKGCMVPNPAAYIAPEDEERLLVHFKAVCVPAYRFFVRHMMRRQILGGSI